MACVLVAASFGCHATAQERSAQVESSLPAVTVIGVTPLPGADINPDQVAGSVQSADSQQIDRSHALDVTDYMRRAFGSVYVNDTQNNLLQPDINFRGYTASPLLGTPQGLSVYLDGVRLNQPFGEVVSWDLIPRAAISSMILLSGSDPIFGFNTLGGALELRTKDGFSDPGVSAEVRYGSHAQRQVELEIGGHDDAGLYWYATGNKLKDAGWREDSPSDAGQAFGKFGWRQANTDIALSGAYARTNLTGNGLQDRLLLENDYDSVFTKPDNTKNKAYLLNLTGTQKLAETWSLSGNIYRRHIRTRTFNGDINDDALGEPLYQPTDEEQAALAEAGYTGFPTSGETQANTPFPSWRCIANILTNDEPNELCNGLANRSRTAQHETGVSLQSNFSSSLGTHANSLVVGVALVNSRAHFTQSSQFGFLTPDRGVDTVDGPGAFADGTQDSDDAFDARVDFVGRTKTRSAYVRDSLQLTPSTQLAVAGRYDHSSVHSSDAITPEDEAGTLTGNHNFGRFNPAVSLTITPRPSLTGYVGFSEGSRAPSAIELGCADPENPCRLPNALAGDPPLKQVVTHTLEAGLRGKLSDRAVWNAGVFRAENRNDIMFVVDDVSGFGYFKNFGKTRRQGVELGTQARFGTLYVGANYTFLDVTYRSSELMAGEGNSSNDAGPGLEGLIQVEPGDRIPLVPRHLGKLFATWKLTPQFAVSADLLAVAGSIARGNENNQHEPDGVFYLGPGRTGGYTLVNFGLEYFPVDRLKLFAQINNAFNRRFYTGSQLGSTGFNAAGNFEAQPFGPPAGDDDAQLRGSTFVAPGAPRAFWFGVGYSVGR